MSLNPFGRIWNIRKEAFSYRLTQARTSAGTSTLPVGGSPSLRRASSPFSTMSTVRKLFLSPKAALLTLL